MYLVRTARYEIRDIRIMLRYRLLFGTLMTLVFTAVVIFDGWLDGSLTSTATDDKLIQGTILCLLVILLIIPAQFELSKLAAAKNLKIFLPVSVTASILFAISCYMQQLVEFQQETYLSLLSAFVLLALLLYQYKFHGTSGVLANCGASYFSILYLGLLSSFFIAIRIEFGLWSLLMFVFVVKSADIGAYSIGSLFGKHKFSPKISPGKTWEGMGGAIGAAIIVAIGFSLICDIMLWWPAIIFGLVFAFVGQLGDLAESMIKRDAEQKDSADKVPGFGGVLDIVDSPLVAAPLAYLFFMYNRVIIIPNNVPVYISAKTIMANISTMGTPKKFHQIIFHHIKHQFVALTMYLNVVHFIPSLIYLYGFRCAYMLYKFLPAIRAYNFFIIF